MFIKIIFLVIDSILGIGAILVILSGITYVIKRIKKKFNFKKSTKIPRHNKTISAPVNHDNSTHIDYSEEILSNAGNNPESNKTNDSTNSYNDLKCGPNDTFCDSRGVIRKAGEDFYDNNDKNCKAGHPFHDSTGIIRFKDERFYDWSAQYFS